MTPIHRQLATFGSTAKAEQTQRTELGIARGVALFALCSLASSAVEHLWGVNPMGPVLSPGTMAVFLIWSAILLRRYRKAS